MLTEKIVVDLGDKRRRREYELAGNGHRLARRLRIARPQVDVELGRRVLLVAIR